MELQYAPQAKSPTRVVPIILAGVLTTALALLGVYLLDAKAEFNIMGWHLNYVIPGGAIIVGLVASSGHGLASYFTGLKIRKGLLWMILLLQLGAYFAASVRPRKVKKEDQPAMAAYTAEQQAAYQQGSGKVNELVRLAAAGDVARLSAST
jgi:hypothetical protein